MSRMKQYITKEQALEIDNQELLDWYTGRIKYGDDIVHFYLPSEDIIHYGMWDERIEINSGECKVKNYEGDMRPMLNIGDMIHFLGDDLSGMDKEEKWWVFTKEKDGKYEYDEKELADALWEAVKHKLKQ